MIGELPPENVVEDNMPEDDLCDVMDAVFDSPSDKHRSTQSRTFRQPIIGGFGERALTVIRGNFADD